MNTKGQWLMCSFVLAMTFNGCQSPRVEKTIGKNKTGMETYLNAHLLTLSPSSNKVAFSSDGELGVRDEAGAWQKDFILGKGEKFMAQPDHHASSSFEVENIKPDSVMVRYLSQFNHTSFGKNLITADEGEIEIQFKNKK